MAHVEASNLQPLLQAVRHHDADGTLRHVWLITTADVVGPDRVVRQTGSQRLGAIIETILLHDCGAHLTVHFADPPLIVAPDDVGPTYRALRYVYDVEVSRVGLRPYQVIADITGARATMTAGMVLACAPRGYPMEYTSTIIDPATKAPSDLPVPQRLRVDTREVLQHSLEALNDRLEREAGIV